MTFFTEFISEHDPLLSKFLMYSAIQEGEKKSAHDIYNLDLPNSCFESGEKIKLTTQSEQKRVE